MKSIPSGRAAILVIDVQRGSFESNPPPHNSDGVVRTINDLTARGRAAGIPVIFVQHEGEPQSGDLVRGTREWELHPALKVDEKDWRVSKKTCDAFFESGLPERLHAQRLDTLIIAGYATDFCIDSSIRNGVSREFEIVILADGHTTNPGGGLSAAQIIAHHNYAWAECITCRPVSVVPAAEINFQS